MCAVTGARKEVYDAGIEMPPGRRRPPAPSRHSGQSSLSPNDPRSSLTCSSRSCEGPPRAGREAAREWAPVAVPALRGSITGRRGRVTTSACIRWLDGAAAVVIATASATRRWRSCAWRAEQKRVEGAVREAEG